MTSMPPREVAVAHHAKRGLRTAFFYVCRTPSLSSFKRAFLPQTRFPESGEDARAASRSAPESRFDKHFGVA
jgi:hypothetical protein